MKIFKNHIDEEKAKSALIIHLSLFTNKRTLILIRQNEMHYIILWEHCECVKVLVKKKYVTLTSVSQKQKHPHMSNVKVNRQTCKIHTYG
jgi:hypothetical protein